MLMLSCAVAPFFEGLALRGRAASAATGAWPYGAAHRAHIILGKKRFAPVCPVPVVPTL